MTRRFPIALLTLALLAGCSSDPQTRLAAIEEDAMAAISELDFDKARSLARKAGEVDPSHPLPAYVEGRIMEAQLQWLDALYNYTLVTIARPDEADAYAGLYRVFRRMSDPEMAAEAAQSYSSLRPDDPRARLVLAEAMIGLNQYVRARRQIVEAAALGLPEHSRQLMKALSFVRQHEFDSAAQLLEQVRSEELTDPRDLMLAADVLGFLGLVDSAMAVSETAVEMSSGNVDMAIEHFYRALEHDYRWAAREVIYSLGENDRSLGLRHMMWLLYYGSTEDQSYARAMRVAVGSYLGETVSVLFYGILAYPPKAHMMAAMDDMNLIRVKVRQEEWPDMLQAYIDYLLAAQAAYYVDEKIAVQALEAVRAPMVNRPDVKTKLPLFRKRVGLDQEADQGLELLIQYHRQQPEWLTAIGEVYATRAFRAWDQAAELFEEALESDNQYRPAYEHWVRMHVRNKEYGRALDIMSKYPHFAERNPELACLEAEMMVRTGKVDEGLSLFLERIPECPHIVSLWERILEPLILKNRSGEIEELAQRAEELAADNPDLLIMAADLASDRGDYEYALNLADRAIEIEPRSHDAAAEKARALFHSDRKDEAFDLFASTRRAHRLNSRNDYWYSRLLARDGRELQLAANVAREALFDRPENVWAWCNLSYVYYQSARWQLAFGEARNCAKQHPEHPLPYFRRGLAEWKMDKPEAAETLRKSLRLGLWGEYKQEAERVLGLLG